MLFHEAPKIQRAAALIQERLGGPVESAVILGTGFSPILEVLSGTRRMPFSEVEGVSSCSAPGHKGEIVIGQIAGGLHVLFSGRLHLYEGRSAGEVAIPVAIAAALGAERILLTCAAGATTDDLSTGDLVLVDDHLNLTGRNPLLEIPPKERRPPFLSMGDAYDRAALDLAEQIACRYPGRVRRGVLAALPGPSFETPAEYRALATLGADLVSMSCVLETIAARSLGLRVLALAIIANGPARLGASGASGDDVLLAVEAALRPRLGLFGELLAAFSRC